LWLPAYFIHYKYLDSKADNNGLYGSGKASDYQIQPMRYAEKNDLTDKIEVP
jgi:hypothetical protein